MLCLSAWPAQSLSLVLLFRYLSCLNNFPHGTLSNTLLWEMRSISFLLSRKSMILSKQDTSGFFFWPNLCLVKLCSILDHFCNSLVKLPFPPNHVLSFAPSGSAQQPQCCRSSSALLSTWPQITPVRVTFLIPFHVLGQKIVVYFFINHQLNSLVGPYSSLVVL